MVDEHPGESRDGTGAGDRDVPYVFGHPQDCLTLLMQARLLVMRGYVMDVRRGATGLPADGDITWTTQTDSGLYVPAEIEP